MWRTLKIGLSAEGERVAAAAAAAPPPHPHPQTPPQFSTVWTGQGRTPAWTSGTWTGPNIINQCYDDKRLQSVAFKDLQERKRSKPVMIGRPQVSVSTGTTLLKKKKKKGRGSKSRAVFGNSCCASMQRAVGGSTVAGAPCWEQRCAATKAGAAQEEVMDQEHFAGQEAEG